MAGNPVTGTAAIARTALPTVPDDKRRGFPPTELGGNPVAASGELLPPSTPDYTHVVKQLHAFVKDGERALRFRVDEATGQTVMTVVNPNTQEVIRQVPPEEVLALTRKLAGLRGLFIDAKA